MNWTIWVLFVGLLWIAQGMKPCKEDGTSNVRNCLLNKKGFVVPDNFNGIISTHLHLNNCIIFLQKDPKDQGKWSQELPQMQTKNGTYLLFISKWHTKKNIQLYVMSGKQCNDTLSRLSDSTNNHCNQSDSMSTFSQNDHCQVRCFHTNTICNESTYAEACSDFSFGSKNNDKYIVNLTATGNVCINCNNPVKKPEKTLEPDDLKNLNITFEIEEGEEVSPAQAAKVMSSMSNLVAALNVSSAELNLGEGVTGILVRETQPEDVDEVSFAYLNPNESINILDSRDGVKAFSRSVTVTKEAFTKSARSNISVAFASVVRFINMAKDEMNSTVLGNEVLAIEMGTEIRNLTDKILISFRNMEYEGFPSCHSWNGEGSRPNWTSDGCWTLTDGQNITCQCSHLTFFAILLTPLHETISSSDLNSLTIITQVGCGLSMFFLGIVLFMHYVMRNTKASKATRILINLVLAMFLLNFSFLVNSPVAKLKNSVGCKIMAALMHYFMLATFTWFAVQAFHLCLQLYMGGKIGIRRYILKVSITSWVLPSVVGIILLIIGKYGEQVIETNDSNEKVSLCWITDSDTHYAVNIGYYVLVFIFTLTTFTIILSWLFCLKRTSVGKMQIGKSGKSGKSIVTILGLCCMLGLTWGFAFFAYGVLRIPAYYIFTVLNSFQGFFLFIYYYSTSHAGEINAGQSNSSSSISTLNTSLGSSRNPYGNMPAKK
ncbi:adhesion G-protein coupled receptor G2-like isoform X2 [Morone saxatilis]|uniref:adhesion G-protein coupled receptor G2-like isoform X2 n=1 Tax=Morone saxatilis TaxID=34816 RepID=UPI0015E20553|nr:adhesion G-protein coupled receptor G2-like isoform X2 [Morone saxatilis]